ncbi:ABC transporter permease [Oceanidesulfovibrio marinus]|uniref:ABC transporter permease n=1 Tax=Oceanidesulfovibrio marinus TaxID=370038 RepID=UPI001184CC74|nr:ABC transporter permease [Oceanidesulfovibrio marinus]
MGIKHTQGELFGAEDQEKSHRGVVLGEVAAETIVCRTDVVGERVMIKSDL